MGVCNIKKCYERSRNYYTHYLLAPRARELIKRAFVPLQVKLVTELASMESTVHLLPHELFVATIPKDAVPDVTHSLLRLLLRLFNGDSRR